MLICCDEAYCSMDDSYFCGIAFCFHIAYCSHFTFVIFNILQIIARYCNMLFFLFSEGSSGPVGRIKMTRHQNKNIPHISESLSWWENPWDSDEFSALLIHPTAAIIHAPNHWRWLIDQQTCVNVERCQEREWWATDKLSVGQWLTNTVQTICRLCVMNPWPDWPEVLGYMDPYSHPTYHGTAGKA